MPPASSWWLLTPFISAPPGLNFGFFVKMIERTNPNSRIHGIPSAFPYSLQDLEMLQINSSLLLLTTAQADAFMEANKQILTWRIFLIPSYFPLLW